MKYHRESWQGDMVVRNYKLPPDILKLAEAGRLVAGVVDPDNTIRRVYSMTPK